MRSVSMDEIANQLGISKKTIYQYYADKDSLVYEVIGMVVKSNEKDCWCRREESENAVHEVFLVMEMVEHLLGHMNPVVMFDLEKYHPKAFTLVSEYRNKFMYNMIKSNLEIGMQQELYKQELDADVLTRYRLATVFLMFNPELFPPAKYHPLRVITEITDHFLYGVVTNKGNKLIQKYKQQRTKKQ